MKEAGAHADVVEIDLLAVLLKQTQLPEARRTAGWERLAESQAKTLDCLFHRLVSVAFCNLQKPHFEPLLRLAFRAQAQSARTLETIAALRNPAVFAKQVNIGQQQVVANGLSYQGGGGGGAATAGQGTQSPAQDEPELIDPESERACLDALTRIPLPKVAA
ncbi:MAG: hypothetical protein ACKV19_20730, partial [Verrucomicrobiales bacterium]